MHIPSQKSSCELLIWITIANALHVAVSGTLTSSITGGVVCPGDVISFTCELNTSEVLLIWNIRSGQLITPLAEFVFSTSQSPSEVTATNVINGMATFNRPTSHTVISTLTFTVTAQQDGDIVECVGVTTRENVVISIASLPSPPQNVMVTIINNGTTNVTVNIDWDPPVNNGGGAVDSYTVETSPETATVRVTPGTTATVDLSYNERYVVSVTAVNCIGNSTSAMTNPVVFVGCSLPSTLQNVTFEPYTSSALGSVIFYQCRSGLIPEGRVMSVCGDDGRWDPDPDQYSCREVNCGAPCLPVNSSVLNGPSSGTLKGSEVTFQCNEGLFPSSEITIVCTSEESWTPDPQGIVCARGEQPVTCTPPGRPRNGFLGEVNSSIIMFGCNEGYSPQGTMTAVCMATDTWSPDPAQLECTTITTVKTIGLSTGAAVGITAVICTLVFLSVGLICGGGGVYIFIRRKYTWSPRKPDESGSTISQDPKPPPVYEDIGTTISSKEAIELQGNVAYGPVKQKH